ncbi:hypothetical protein B296_00031195 [Ensete ventricosum]|uniref:Secreted protein n=1 Tax=Ensete ventricosum TaxID=4639 RepID=A0A427AGU5_ENSVE|nr:hypothetical protein B296_00031195 [Ensete ventricosum]
MCLVFSLLDPLCLGYLSGGHLVSWVKDGVGDVPPINWRWGPRTSRQIIGRGSPGPHAGANRHRPPARLTTHRLGNRERTRVARRVARRSCGRN